MSDKPSHGLAIVGLYVNLFVMPGLGTLIAGKIKIGIFQLSFYIIAVAIALFGVFGGKGGVNIKLWLLGIFLSFAIWLWSIFTAIGLLRASKEEE